MPITPPTLDDLSYDRAVQELTRRIPQYAPEWTNWNDSDPGITLIQLFAHLAEQVCYRLNRVPEKNHIELLKLLGVALRPAEPAVTRVALLLDKPTDAQAGALSASTRIDAPGPTGPLTFETTAPIDTVPCEVAAIVTTKNPHLNDLLRLEAGGPEVPLANDLNTAAANPKHNAWLSLRWDGKKPKLKDMPAEPITLLTSAFNHSYLWLGLNFNKRPAAGFLGVRVTLTVHFDDDEQPSHTAAHQCGALSPLPESAPVVNWLHVLDSSDNLVDVSLSGPVADTTDRLRHSGRLSFFVPTSIASPGQWQDLRKQGTLDPLEACRKFGPAMTLSLDSGMAGLNNGNCATMLPGYATALKTAIAEGTSAVDQAAGAALPQIIHPLPPDLQTLPGWLRITLAPSNKDGAASPKLRIASFNAVPVMNRSTVTGELIGVSDGQAGQTFQLRNTNVQPGTLDLQVQEGPFADSPLVAWSPGDLDAAGPSDRIFQIDWEAGVLTFGDGRRGMIPPSVPTLGRLVARRYAHGGGAAGNIAVGAIKAFSDQHLGITSAVNFIAASGGKDSELLEDAKVRARREISSRSRAVTATDFEFIASQTPGVRVALARTVPLRAPLVPGNSFTDLDATSSACGTPVPSDHDRPAGLAGIDAAGVVAVVVVPDEPGPEPTPTPSFLAAVCRQLDGHRLVTTEVFVVSPQYCRVCQVVVEVTGKPGFTRAMLQDRVAIRLQEYLHVLRGGHDRKGYGFGGQLLAADLVAQIFRVEGIETVRSLTCRFVRTKTDTSPREGVLTLCPEGVDEYAQLMLGPDETASIVPNTVSLSIV